MKRKIPLGLLLTGVTIGRAFAACRTTVMAAVLVTGVCVFVNAAVSQDDRAADVDNTRTTIEKWVETRRIISKEKEKWVLGREMLNEWIELVQREIDSLREKIAESHENITTEDRKRDELIQQSEKLRQASSTLLGTVDELESGVKKLLPRLPEPIVQRVRPLSQRLGKKTSDENGPSLSERFQNIVGILNEINKFHREITVTSEVRRLANGSSAEVSALYIGISQGYYVGGNGKVAGIGSADEDGWVWVEANEAAPAIIAAIAIVKNEQVASFIQLPIEIK